LYYFKLFIVTRGDMENRERVDRNRRNRRR